MRIGIFTDTYPPFINGVSTSILSLEKALKAQGHEVFIVTVNPDDMSYKYEEDDHIIRIPGIPVGIYDYRLTGIYPLKSISKIRDWNLDIIHSHTEFGIGTYARIFAKQFNIPLVHTYHTMWEDYVHYITKGHFDKSSKKVVEYLTTFYCDKTAKELIVPSRKTYNLFVEKYQIEKDIRIVPTGIEVSRFFKETFNEEDVLKIKKELGISKEDFVVLSVGRLAKEKNFEFLLEAHKKLVKKNKNIKLVIVGSGPDYETFVNWVSENGLEKSIIFTNSIPWEDIPIYYQIADVFATASKTETQGLTVVEAMAASKPVVCIRDDAFLDVVENGLNGVVFERQKEYMEAILDLVGNSDKLESMSKQARFKSEEYSLEHYALNILNVYKDCLKREKPKKKWYNRLKDRIKGHFSKKN